MQSLSKSIALAAAGLTLSGCQIYTAARYSASAANVEALRSLQRKYPQGRLRVSDFLPGLAPLREITCRGAGPILPPDKKTFAQYIRAALIEELRMAGVYAEESGTEVAGELMALDFSSFGGTWTLAARITAGSPYSFDVAHENSYDTSFEGTNACAQTAQAFMPTVQDFVKKLIASPQFERALAESAARAAVETAASQPGTAAADTVSVDVDAAWALEKKRVGFALAENDRTGEQVARYSTAGERNTTLVVVVNELPGADDAARRLNAEKALEVFLDVADVFTPLGFTRLVVRHEGTGIEASQALPPLAASPATTEP